MIPPLRVGHGRDLHALVEGRPLVLGGVVVPFERGLSGHSDGDVISHAIADAVLGAAGLDDLGAMFPPGDPTWSGVSSLVLLEHVHRRVSRAGIDLVNVDAVVVAQRPRLADHLAEMRRRLAAALAVEVGRVSLKAKSPEGLGALGRGDGIEASAVALVCYPAAPVGHG